MVHGISYQYNCSWFFLKKRHWCPKCKVILELKKKEKIVNSESEEARNYDFSCVDTYMVGNIKFVTFYFECPNCGAIYEIRELKRIEKELKQASRKKQKFFNFLI